MEHELSLERVSPTLDISRITRKAKSLKATWINGRHTFETGECCRDCCEESIKVRRGKVLGLFSDPV